MPCTAFTRSTTPKRLERRLNWFGRCVALFAALSVPFSQCAWATTYLWTGTTSGNLSGTTTNYSPNGTPGSSDIIEWNAASYTNAPTANANMSLGELWFASGDTAGVTFGTGAFTLTLSGVSSIGIEVDNGSGAVSTGSAKFAIAGNQQWKNNSANTLTVGGTITNTGNTTPYTITFNGSGSTLLNGIISNGGSTGTLALTESSGTLTLGGANTLTGGIALNGGSLIATIAGAFGTSSNTLTFGGGNLTLQAAATTFTGAINLNSQNETISVNPASAGNGVTQTISGALTLGTETTTMSAGALTTNNTNYGLTLSGAASFSAANSNATFTINGNGSGNGTLTLSGGFNTGGNTDTLTFNTGTGSGTDSAAISGAFTGTAGTLILAGSAPVSIGSLTSTANAMEVNGTGTYTFNGTSTFTGGVLLNNSSATVIATTAGGLGTGGQVTFNTTGTTLDLRGATVTYTSGINSASNGGTITVEPAASGAGVTNVLSGANTLGTKTIVMSAGALTTSNSAYGLTLSGATSFNASGTNATFTINGNGSGNGTLTLSGGFNTGGNTDTLTFNTGTGSGTDSAAISGAFTGTAGTLILAGSAPVSIGSLTSTANAMEVNGTGTYTFNGTSTFTGGVLLNNSSATVIATTAGGLGATSGQVTFNTAGTTLDLKAGATTFTSGINTSTNGGTITVEPASAGAGVTQTMSLANTLGSQTLVFSPGAGVTSGNIGLTLSGANSFSGANTNAVFTINGPTGFTGNATLTLSGGFNTGGNTDTLTFNTGTGSGTDSAAISGAFTGTAGTLILAGNANVTVGALTSTANAVDVNGTGTYTFNGASTFTGGLTIQAGTVTASTSASALGGSGTGAVTLGNTTGSSAATLLVSTTGLTFANAITLATNSNNPTLTIGNTGTAISTTFSGGVTGTQNLTINENATSGTITFSTASLNNTGTITNIGAGTGATTISSVIGTNVTGVTENSTTSELILSGANTYTGGTTISAGTLEFVTTNTMPASGTVAVQTGGTLAVQVGTGSYFTNTTSNTAGSIGGLLAGTGGQGAAVTYAGNVALGIDTTPGSFSYGGIIADVGTTLGITKLGANTLTLSGNNTYSGGTTISAGTLQVGSATALGASTGNVSVSSGAALDLNGTTMTNTNALTLNGTGISSGGALTNSSATAVIYAGLVTLGSTGVSIGGTGLITLSNAGTIYGTSTGFGLTLQGAGGTVASIINGGINGTAGAGALTVNSTGTWTLTGANTYTGATTVGGGTLQIGNGSAGSLNGTTGTPLTFNGQGTANFDEASGVSQGMTGALTFSAGEGTVESSNNGGTSTLTFGSLAAHVVGATGNFVLNGGTAGTPGGGATAGSLGTNNIAFTTSPGAGTLLSPGLFYNGGSYAAYDAGGFIRAYKSGDTGYLGQAAGTSGVSGASSTSNVVLTGNVSGQTGALTINTLSMGANTFALTSGTLSTAGILSSGNNAATLSGGALQAATSGGELIVNVNLPSNVLTVTSTLQDNSSASNLTKAGAGTLIINTSATYTGNTYINEGTLQFGNGTAITLDGGTYTNSIVDSGSLVFDSTSGNILKGNISGAGSVTEEGTGTLTLQGPAVNTFTGGLNILAGEVAIVNSSALGSSAINIGNSSGSSNAEFYWNTGGNSNVSNPVNVIAGSTGTDLIYANSGAPNFTSVLTLANNLSLQNTNSVASSVLTFSGGVVGTGNISVNNSNNSSGGGTTFSGGALSFTGTISNVSTVSAGVTVSANMTGAESLIENSTGGSTMTVSGNNTNTGTTTVTLGTLEFTTENSLYNDNGSGQWTTSNIIVGPGGTLVFEVGNTGGFTSSDIGTLAALGSSTGGFENGSTIGIDTTGGSFTCGNVIANTNGGANVLNLTKLGSNTLTLTGVNTYTGPTTISAGTLTISGAGQLNSGSYAGNITDAGAFIYDSTAAQTLSGIISGAGTLTLNSGAGTLTLNGINTFTGATAINGGAIQLGAAQALQDTAVTISSANGLTFAGGIGTFAIASLAGTGNENLVDANSAAVTLISGSNNTTTTYSGNLTGAGALVKVGTGTLTLSGNNTYAGTTTVSGGTLDFAKEVSLYNDVTASWTASNLIVAAGATLAFEVGNTGGFTSSDISTLSGLGTSSGGFESGSFLGIDTTGGSFTYGNVIANTNSGSNAIGLNKLGTNSLILTAAETYTGATSITAGTLQLGNATTNGSIASSASILDSGALLFEPAASTTETYGNSIGGGGTVTINGNANGIVALGGVNTYTGATTITAGTLDLKNSLALQDTVVSPASATDLTFDSSVASNAFTLGGLGSNQNITLQNTAGVGITLTIGSVTNSSTTYTGNFLAPTSGVGALTLFGFSNTITLEGASTYTGATTVDGAILNLGGSTANGSINSGSALVLGGIAGGGTLNYTRVNGTTAESQTFNGTSIIRGENFITTSTAYQTLNLGALTDTAGGTVDITPNTTSSIITTTANTNGILGGWATYGGKATWAVGNSGSTITGLATGSYTATVAGTTAPGSTANVDFGASNTTSWNTQTINSLRFNSATGYTLTLATGQLLTIASGGILNTPTATATSTITGGFLTGSAGGQLAISTAAGLVTIGSQIEDNGGATAVVLSGTSAAQELTLSGSNNSFSGGFYLDGGGIKQLTAGGTPLGVGDLFLGNDNIYTNSAGGGIVFGTATNVVSLGLIASANGNNFSNGDISGNSGGIWNLYGLSGDTETFAGIIGNYAGGRVANFAVGSGTEIIGNTQIGSSAVIANGGTFQVGTGYWGSFSNQYNNVVLTLGGGTYVQYGLLAGTTTQTYAGGLTVNAGASTVTVDNNSGEGTLIALTAGTTRNTGGTVNFNLPSGTQTAVNGITTTTLNTNGILGGYATVGGNDWATNATNTSGGNIIGLSSSTINSYTASTATTTAPGSTANVDFQASNSTAWGTQTINSLRFNTAGGATLTITTPTTNILTISSGGILVTSSVGGSGSANYVDITGGEIKGAASGDLVIIQNNTSAGLEIDSVIANNGTTALTKSGAGTLKITGANGFTGGLYLNGGVLNATSGAINGTNNAINFNGGTLQAASAISDNKAVSVGTNGGTIDLDGYGVTLSGAITGVAGEALGAGAIGSFDPTGVGLLTVMNSGGGQQILSLSNTGNAYYGGVTINGNATVQNAATSGATALGSGYITFGSGSGTPTVDLDGHSATVAGLIGAGTNGVITSSASGTPTLTLDGAFSETYNGIIKNGSATSVALTVNLNNSTEAVTLGGANTYSGATTITAGNLVAENGSALGTGNVTVASGAGLDYEAQSNTPLTLGGTLAITGGANTVLGTSIGSSTTGAEISVTGAATISNAALSVNVYGVSGLSPTTGTYTLIAGGASSNLDPTTTPTLGLIYNNSNFTVGTFTPSASSITLGITAQSQQAAEYWTGGLAGATNVWAASNGTTASNWVTAAGGGATALTPGASTAVTVAATTPALAPTGTLLGADMTINSLTINTQLGLDADGNTLTITPTSSANGINVTGGLASTIAANVALGANQTWTNSTGNTLTISGNVSSGSTYTLTTAGSGTILLSGANTYTGGTTISAGTVKIGSATALGASSGAVSVTAGAALDLNGTTMTNTNALTLNGTGIGSGGALTNSSSTAATYAGLVTLGSSGAAIGGTGLINLSNAGTIYGTSTGFGLTLQGAGGSVASIINGGTSSTAGAGALTVNTTGTWTLTGANTYSGGTIVTSGILDFVSGALGTTGGITVNGGTLQWASGNTQDISSRLTLQNSGSATLDTQANNVTLASGFGGSTSSSVTKVGSGNLTLNGVTTYTGATNINGGTLTAGVASSLGSTSAVNVNSTGTLLLGASSAVNSSATMKLNGGTFEAAGFSQGTANGASAPTAGLGALTLSANSTIDFNTGSGATTHENNVIAFAASGSQTWTGTLTINDWDGVINSADGANAGGTDDALYFGTDNTATSLTAAQLAEIQFDIGGKDYAAAQASNGEVYAVPEPSTVFAALALFGFVGYRERRRLRRLAGLAVLLAAKVTG